MLNEQILLKIENLKTEFKIDDQSFLAVDDVSLVIKKGKTLGLVGESGCGKSVTSLSIMRLIASPGKIVSGKILYKDMDIVSIPEDKVRTLRGKEMTMIFQEPMTSLNPVFTIGFQIEEVIKLHHPEFNGHESKSKTIEMLKKVGIPSPEQRYHEYPHQLSGGMRQRVMIAMALSCNPHLLIADEPTTALDVTIQAQILDLLRKLQSEFQMGMILITHDLGVVAEMCDEVAVMYAGKIVEYANVHEIFKNPKHPYTKGLLDSIPHFDSGHKLERLNTIAGLVPSLTSRPRGCRFNDRCPFVQDKCRSDEPALQYLDSNSNKLVAANNETLNSKNSIQHQFACHFPLNLSKRDN